MIVATHGQDLKGLTVYLKPTYAVVMPFSGKKRGPLTELQRLNLKHLKRNKHTGMLSRKAQKRLVNSVNWLVASAPKKTVYDKKTRKRHSFKINFVTLTLPGSVQEISDNKFKKVLMHAFINSCRYRYNLKNFVWKVEAQANGKIHAHFTTDTFMPWYGIREIWNSILEKNGLIDSYRAKHSSMNLHDYINEYKNYKNVSIADLKRRFEQGVKDNWSNPNSTDIHAVYKVADIAAYISKYMSKNETEKRPIKGRLWSCSYSISQANKTQYHIPFEGDFDALDCLFDPGITHMELKPNNNPKFANSKVGDLFFFTLDHWRRVITGPLSELYHKVLFNIRHNIDFNHFEPVVNNVVENVEKVIEKVITVQVPTAKQLVLFNNYGK